MARNDQLERLEILRIPTPETNLSSEIVLLLALLGQGNADTLQTLIDNQDKIKELQPKVLLVDGGYYDLINLFAVFKNSKNLNKTLATITSMIIVNIDKQHAILAGGLAGVLGRTLGRELSILSEKLGSGDFEKKIATIKKNKPLVAAIIKQYATDRFSQGELLNDLLTTNSTSGNKEQSETE